MPRILLPAFVLGLVLFNATAPAGGDIYVGGPWGTKIASLPYEIKTPGSYYLGGTLTYSGSGNGITVGAGVNHVTLDLMGFTLNGSGSGNYGIFLFDCKNVEIRNGTVTGWAAAGIQALGSSTKLHRIINVRAVGNSIRLLGSGHLIKGCEVSVTGANIGVELGKGTVRGCTVQSGNLEGISTEEGIVSENVVTCTGTGTSRIGIRFVGSYGISIKGNKVRGCVHGIFGSHPGLNVIGNTVDAASGTTGITLNDDYSTLLDQNTVTGSGAHYNATYTKVQWRNNY